MLSAYLYLIDPPPGQPRFLPEQVMFGGDSAGGNLAVSALLWLRKEKYPLPAGLALMSPWV